jgi:DHA1 family bicyclomycin/chloramphenicol resistance-like MFS transporter
MVRMVIEPCAEAPPSCPADGSAPGSLGPGGLRSRVGRSGDASFVALVLACGIGPVALDMYLPAMPAMEQSLHTSASTIQLTVTCYIVGMALGQLFAGPISDGTGRRWALLAPALVFTAASGVAASTHEVTLLLGVRALQGAAAGAAIVVGRAVVGDMYRGDDLAARLGTMVVIVQIGPVVAPVLGSAILGVGSWRAIFWAMTAVGAVMTAWIAVGVPETLPRQERHGRGLTQTLLRMRTLLRDWEYLKHVVVACAMVFGFFVYLGGSSFVLHAVYGVSASQYAVVFGSNAAAMVIGALFYRVMVPRWGPQLLRAVGVTIGSVAATLLVAVAVAGPRHLPGVETPWALLAVIACSMGLVSPATATLALQAGGYLRGTASSLLGGLSLIAGALATPLTGLAGSHSLLPMALLMLCGYLASAALLVTVTRPRHTTPTTTHRQGAPDQPCT